MTLSAAAICLASLLLMMVVFPGSATNFETETAATFAALRECLTASLYRVGARETKMEVSYYRNLYGQLLQRSIKLNETYSQAAFEIRVGRLSRMSQWSSRSLSPSHYSTLMTVQAIHPFISVVEHLRRELAWGLGPVKPLRSAPGTPRSPALPGSALPSAPRTPRSRSSSVHEYFPRVHQDLAFVSVIEPPALELADKVLDALKTVEHLIVVTFHQRATGHSSEAAQSMSGSQKAAVDAAERNLVVARDSMREVLRHVFDLVDMQQRAEGKKAHLPKEIFDCSLAAIALLQVRP